jgi:plasmid stabilization system protein ParE
VGGSFVRLSRFSLTEIAWADLDSIHERIARDSVRHADLVEEAILGACLWASERPNLGHRRPHIRNPRVRFLSVPDYPNYSIAYLIDSKPLTVIRVVHGARTYRRCSNDKTGHLLPFPFAEPDRSHADILHASLKPFTGVTIVVSEIGLDFSPGTGS